MGAECFCGCGRTIPLHRLGLRTYNTRGKKAAKRLAWMRDELGDAEPDAEAQAWLADGDEIVGLLAGIVHRETDPRTVDESAVRQWQAEGRGAERELVSRRARFGRAILESEQSEEGIMEAFEHGDLTPADVIEAVEQGDDDPFGGKTAPPPPD
jgi:hypothetical protein